MSDIEKENRPQDDPATSSINTDIITPDTESVNADETDIDRIVDDIFAAAKPQKASSTDDAAPTDAAPAEDTALTEDAAVPDAEAVPEREMRAEVYRIPAPDPIADIAAAHRYLSDIAERWNVNMPDLLDYVGRLDTIARVMTKKNQPERT